MSFLSLVEDTVSKKVADQEGNTATFTLKRILSKKDVNSGFEAMVEATRDIRSDDRTPVELPEGTEAPQLNLDMVLSLPVGQLAILKLALVGWDLSYPKGHPDHPAPVPLDEENIELLASPIVDELCNFVKDLNHVKTKEEVANLETS